MIRFLFLLFIFFSAFSLAQPLDERWYLGVNAGIIVPDDNILLNEAQIYDVRLGKTINQDWSYEFEAFTDEYDFNIDYGLKHHGLMINFLNVNNEVLWKPYFLMGAGFIYHNSPVDSGINPVINIGLGGSWYFFGDNVRLRLEAVSRLDFNNTKLPGQDGFGDAVFTFGLTIPIGN